MFDAGSADNATTAVNNMLIAVEAMSPFRADSKALSAVDAPDWQKTEFGFRRPRFRIMAPAAPHRAALEENSRANSRSVVYRESLYIENYSFNRIRHF